MKIDLLPRPEPVHPLWTAVLTGTAGLLAIANLWAGATWVSALVQTRASDAAYRDAAARLPALQRQANEQQQRETLTRQIDAFEKWAASRPDFQDEVHLLSTLLPKNSALLSVHFVGGASYDVRASLPDLESVATYLRALQTSDRVASVTVKSVNRQTAAVQQAAPGPTGTPRPAPSPTGFRPAASAPDGPAQTWVDRLWSSLPWSPGVARASDGPPPEPSESGGGAPDGGSTAPGGPGNGAPPSTGSAPGSSVPGLPWPWPFPLPPGTTGTPGGTPAAGSAPGQAAPAQTVYILEFNVTLGR